MKKLFLSGVLLAVWAIAQGPAQAASFDCTLKTLAPDEKAICANRDLNDADVQMVTTLNLLSGLMMMGGRGALWDDQAAWLKQRQACGGDIACIRKAYASRLNALQGIYDGLNKPL
ncbi:lysozyme inhibitor LprI family protein [Aestuariivirga sp.]|uniref:lysozyme inhibitor LprI family protein n=1 Tax=Aestuariivirga sp. TaxID=2650926 RepID=UPI0039E26A45